MIVRQCPEFGRELLSPRHIFLLDGQADGYA